jgi:type II secretory pathway pseudopilin PulG
MKIHSKKNLSKASGFTLVEVIVALGLFVFAVTALMGVLPFGMKQVQTTSNESFSMTTMESIRDDISLALSSKAASSFRYGIDIPGVGTPTPNPNPNPISLRINENGENVGTGVPAVLRITGTLNRPATGPIHLNLRSTWPATAPAGREAGSTELVTAFQP